ncbi:MAG: YicC family protein, partial [Lachnospiraceae bacterium]|nr:YicC family protein [Lachnospiraceae bacterium]
MEIRSMTGFGRSELDINDRKYTVEIKTVNHRFFEVNVKLPKILNMFDSNIRTALKDHISRGKVDVFITFEDNSRKKGYVKYNSDLAHEYYDYLQEMSKEFSLRNDISVGALSRYPDVFTTTDAEFDEDEIWAELGECIKKAAGALVETRKAEGESLRKDLIDKLDQMKSDVAVIEEKSPVIVENYRNRLKEKVAELISDRELDEGRITTEVVIYADKICVDEEIVRLKSHIDSMKDTLIKGGSCGRKLDFIAQEMNREANTTLSKAGDISISDIAIDLKTGIEKIREQI